MAIDLKRHEQIALLKFMLIYMVTSFALLAIVALLYYLDAKKDAVINVRTDMLVVLSKLRVDPKAGFEKYSVKLEDAAHHNSPHFVQKDGFFELVACANPEYQGKVFVITAPTKIASDYTDDIYSKIIAVYLLLFIPFLLLGYALARIALLPLKKAYESILSFNADIIHDLKTPITTIGINADMLNYTSSKQLLRIKNSVKTLEGLYLNLETYLRTGSHLKTEPIELKSLIEERAEIYRSLYRNAEITVLVDRLECFADRVSITRVIDNLVANAIKYGGRTPQVSIALNDSILSIADNGRGIANQEKIFNRNYREWVYVTGYGLGLNIVKTLTERLKIGVQVTTGESGTVVFLDIGSLLEK